MSDSLKTKTFKNVGYNATSKIVAALVQIIANIILARNLSSDDYGIVGIAWIFMGFLLLFNDMGINGAVIHKRTLDEDGLYTAFSMKAALGVLLFIIAFIIAPITPYLFDNQAVVTVLRILSLNFLINIFYFIPDSFLKRDLDYKKISVANLLSVVLGSSVTIVLALSGFKYWSIVFGSLITSVILAIALNIFRPVKIKIRFDAKQAKGFLNYGLPLAIGAIITFIVFNADNFIIGTLKGSSMLGYYTVAFRWPTMACLLLGTVVHSVLFPTYSTIQDDKEKIKRAYLRTLEYVGFLIVLINGALFLVSKEFLIHVLGHGSDKWLPALTALKILCIYGILRALLEPVGSVILAVGRTKLFFRANLLAAILELILLYPALKYFGIPGVAIIVTIAYVSQYIIYSSFLSSELNVQLKDLLKTVTPAFVAISVMIPVYLLYEYLSLDSSLFLMFQKMFVYVMSYILLYGIITKWKILKEVIIMIKAMKKTLI